jgi:hypothetical protein
MAPKCPKFFSVYPTAIKGPARYRRQALGTMLERERR